MGDCGSVARLMSPKDRKHWPKLVLQLLRASVLNFTKEFTRPSRFHLGRADLDRLLEAKVDSLYYFNQDLRSSDQDFYETIWAVQREALSELLEAFVSKGIPVIVFKGAEIVERYYRSRPISLMADIDLLVRAQDVPMCKSLLYRFGLRPGKLGDDGVFEDLAYKESAAIELHHYELPPFGRVQEVAVDEAVLGAAKRIGSKHHAVTRDSLLVEISFDVHARPFADVGFEELWSRVVPSKFEGGLALEPSDHLWLILAKYYMEVALHGKRILRDFAYAIPIVCDSNLDWENVVNLAREHNLGNGILAYLSFLHRLGCPLPDHVSRELRKNGGTRRLGWQLAPLFECDKEFPLWLDEQIALANCQS